MDITAPSWTSLERLAFTGALPDGTSQIGKEPAWQIDLGVGQFRRAHARAAPGMFIVDPVTA
ncbi:MAG: hypothetical protein R3F31_13930 [Verrucomicrobiales bacterium]